MSELDDVAYLIELREVYDGWSIKVLHDGTWVNRWPETDRRHAPTQLAIEHHLSREVSA
jgi:hypothetical protein